MPPKPTAKPKKAATPKKTTPVKGTSSKKATKDTDVTTVTEVASVTPTTVVKATKAKKTVAVKPATPTTKKLLKKAGIASKPLANSSSSKAVSSPKSVDLEPDALKQQLLNELRSQLKRSGLSGVGRPPRLLVAFSGGGDSTALLHLLSHLRDAGEVQFMAGYYHHNWRGTPPPELQRVHKTCQRFRVPLVFLPPHPKEEQSEHSARHYRYERLLQVAQQYKAEAVLTAHHQDDQIETLMFRLFRGTGLDGLEGIQQRLFYNNPESETQSTTPIIRPLLNVAQAQLAQYVAQQELAFFEDPSNKNVRHARNAIRHSILPHIESQFPHYRKALLKLSHLTQGDLSILHNITPTQWDALELKQASPSVFQVGSRRSTTLFCQLNTPYQRRLVRHLLGSMHIEASYDTTERVIHFINQDVRKGDSYSTKPVDKLSLGYTNSGDARFLLRSPKAFWVEIHPARNEAYQALVSQHQVISLSGGLVTLPWDDGQALRVEPFPRRAGVFDVRKLPKARSKEILVHAEAYEDKTLTLRSRKPGDWIKPLGMGGKRIKLKNFFISQHIPQELRDEWPVVACEDEILWVPGVGINEALRITQKKSPTHTWMLGGTEDLSQLRTLKFLEESLAGDDEEDDTDLDDLTAITPTDNDTEDLNDVDVSDVEASFEDDTPHAFGRYGGFETADSDDDDVSD
jgi:tRNA(Ile)-lysidine synthase